MTWLIASNAWGILAAMSQEAAACWEHCCGNGHNNIVDITDNPGDMVNFLNCIPCHTLETIDLFPDVLGGGVVWFANALISLVTTATPLPAISSRPEKD